MPLSDWKERKFEAVYQACLAGLERQRRTDPSFTPEAARGVLEHLYIQEGND